MDEIGKDSVNEKTPGWLQKLQLHSWEPEILLSGIVLYGMFQTPDLLDKSLVYLQINFGSTGDLENLFTILKVAIYWLTFGLILHLVSRGIWVGMVGLSFTFPKGIDVENLKLAPKFKHHLEKIPSMQTIIIALEKICSSLFSISFMLFMCMIGGYFYLLFLIIIPIFSMAYLFYNGDIGAINDTYLGIYVITIMIIGLVGFIDFITLGFLKRFKFISKIYWPIYRFIGVMTLSRLYRPIYYSLVSNISNWKISIFLIVFVVVSFYMTDNISSGNDIPGGITRISMWSNSRATGSYSGYYDDQNSEITSQRAHIQSDIIKGNTLRLFLVSRADLEDSIKAYCNYDSLRNKLDTARQYVNLHCLDKFFRISIDDSLLTNLQWKFHYKSHTEQKGILTWINVRNLDEGLYSLQVEGPKEMYRFKFASIPFYREINASNYIPENQPARKEEEGSDYLKLKPILPK